MRFTIGLLRVTLALALVRPATGTARATAGQGGRLRAAGQIFGWRIRWDFYDLDFNDVPAAIVAGGSASARGRNGSSITLTGSGVFGGNPRNVSGGGTWTTSDPSGRKDASGSYRVSALAGFFPRGGSS